MSKLGAWGMWIMKALARTIISYSCNRRRERERRFGDQNADTPTAPDPPIETLKCHVVDVPSETEMMVTFTDVMLFFWNGNLYIRDRLDYRPDQLCRAEMFPVL